MRIQSIYLENFRIYAGKTLLEFIDEDGKNVALIAGKNGFGKTTFLTSLIWGLYGNQMSHVEEKYRSDIKNSGGYESYLKTLINKTVRNDYENGDENRAKCVVELRLIDVVIPSIPCREVVIRRVYDYSSGKESLEILIDGEENKLTKEVGFEVFINDFILPREIAKFFFFDAEKIVTLAEAKSKAELRTLSKAYSEVLGIKKYEDLKSNLKTLLTKLRRDNVSGEDVNRQNELEKEEAELKKYLAENKSDTERIEEDITTYKLRLDETQEKLFREGNSLTVEELKELKLQLSNSKRKHEEAKADLKKMMEFIPLAIAGNQFDRLAEQVRKELSMRSATMSREVLTKEFDLLEQSYLNDIRTIIQDTDMLKRITASFNKSVEKHLLTTKAETNSDQFTLNVDDEITRSILSVHIYVRGAFKEQFTSVVKREKEYRQEFHRTQRKIRNGESRKDNHLVNKLRADKEDLDKRIQSLYIKKEELLQELGSLNNRFSSNQKVLSELRKKANLVATDREKYEVTTQLIEKLDQLIVRIKEEKKFALQKSIQIGLHKLMHKDNFVSTVRVRIEDDVMDIDLIDQYGKVIDKDTLSKGEQQLYATALLKALVDESGIDFPVFIDSPLQKFDKIHSRNVIKNFYPSISDQVVLFPLLEKELSLEEYDQLKESLSGVYLISNSEKGSKVEACGKEELFTKFEEQNHVFAH